MNNFFTILTSPEHIHSPFSYTRENGGHLQGCSFNYNKRFAIILGAGLIGAPLLIVGAYAAFLVLTAAAKAREPGIVVRVRPVRVQARQNVVRRDGFIRNIFARTARRGEQIRIEVPVNQPQRIPKRERSRMARAGAPIHVETRPGVPQAVPVGVKETRKRPAAKRVRAERQEVRQRVPAEAREAQRRPAERARAERQEVCQRVPVEISEGRARGDNPGQRARVGIRV